MRLRVRMLVCMFPRGLVCNVRRSVAQRTVAAHMAAESMFAGMSVADTSFTICTTVRDAAQPMISDRRFIIPEKRDPGYAVNNNVRLHAFAMMFDVLPEGYRRKALRNVKHFASFGHSSSFSCSMSEIPIVEDRFSA